MGTLFETLLAGSDEEHLVAVADAVLEEVARVERLLSRFDPRSEISRLNRQAADRGVLVDYELLAILQACQNYWQATGGYFDPVAGAGARATMADLAIDPAARRVRFTNDQAQLDLGGFGKGYALDCAARLLAEHQVAHALLHGGTSSVLARGCQANGQPWRVGVTSPAVHGAAATELAQIALGDAALSSSGVLAAGASQQGLARVEHTAESDIIDPHRHARLVGQAGCVVVAASGAEAEAWSTALLSMGKQQAVAYTQKETIDLPQAVGWIDCQEELAAIEWLLPAPGSG